jgi:hypothetical protein
MVSPVPKPFCATDPFRTAEVRSTDVAAEVVAEGEELCAVVSDDSFAVDRLVGLPIAVYHAAHDDRPRFDRIAASSSAS